MADIDKRRRAVAFADMELIDVQLEPVKIEADFANAHAAMNTRGDRPGHDMAKNRRHREISRDPKKQNNGDDDHADFARPPRSRQLTQARAQWQDVLARSL